MAKTFTIGGVSFGALQPGIGRQAFDFRYHHRNQKISRHTIFGVKGRLVTRGGSNGRKILAVMRYVGEDETGVEALIKADMDAWENAAVTILYAGLTFKRCQLDDDGMKPIGDMRGCIPGGVYVDVAAQFTEDAGEDE